jgi:HEXXH motif-containing protein
MTDLGFEPDAQRARWLDRRMHEELAGSLRYVRACLADRPELRPERIDATTAVIDGEGRVEPGVFAAYYRLVEALSQGDRPAAERALERLGAAVAIPPGRRHAPLADPTGCARSRTYVNLLRDGAEEGLGLTPLPTGRAVDFEPRFERGVALMREAIPELAGEVEAIVHEVVAVGSDPAAQLQVDGGSHYQLWGALFLNADFHPTDAAMLEVIAHESAHSLLFGFCTEEPLVTNDDDERYPSPLRTDLRPMDGIYHATFVSARMHWAMARLLAADVLDGAAREHAVAARDADRRHFEAGWSVVARHGRLTPLGRELMAGARRHMDAAAA